MRAIRLLVVIVLLCTANRYVTCQQLILADNDYVMANEKDENFNTKPIEEPRLVKFRKENETNLRKKRQSAANPCVSNPCQNGGTCSPGVNTFSCLCPPGFSGTSCQVSVNLCSSNPCQNGGTCSPGANTFSCLCPTGFSGTSCQIQSVTSCLNVNDNVCNYYLGLGIRCTSTAYIGAILFSNYCCRSCSGSITSSACSSSPCLNGATCLSVSTTSYVCQCPVGTSGSNCQFLINACNLNSNPCLNGGFCNSFGSSFSCICPPSYTGTRCESLVTTSTCSNVNDNTCSFFLSRGIQCSSSAYIGTLPFSTYCCRSCNGGSTSQTCTDVLNICPLITQYCSSLASNSNHPCRRSCNLC